MKDVLIRPPGRDRRTLTLLRTVSSIAPPGAAQRASSARAVPAPLPVPDDSSHQGATAGM